MKRINTLLSTILLLIVSITYSSCEKEPVKKYTGVSRQTWLDVNNAPSGSCTVTYDFIAADNWVVTSSENWCTINPLSGVSGANQIVVVCERNQTAAARVAVITMTVGNNSPAIFKVNQVHDGEEVPGENIGENQWMFDYMKSHYLWNEPLNNVTPNYNLPYKNFLSSMLDSVALQGNVNRDDGKWINGQRQYYYSNVTRDFVSRTRQSRPTKSGFGIYDVVFSKNLNNSAIAKASILGVVPGSPADILKFKRGDVIVKVDGKDIPYTNAGINSVFNILVVNPSNRVSVSMEEVVNGQYVIKDPQILNKTSYQDNPIWKYEVILDKINNKKVGYLVYSGFEYTYDDELLEVFRQFKTEGVDELVLDFRYNSGGHVISSLIIGTAVAGADNQGKTYLKTTYNKSRTETAGIYQIGNATVPGSEYTPIETALSNSLDKVKRVFVLGKDNTASASELVINGLRGLDIPVYLIGQTTNGKNTGMEGRIKTNGQYKYVFSPITFYSENAKGFKDFGSGFKPDVEIDEFAYKISNFGDYNESLLGVALEWIETGSKPSSFRSTRSAVQDVKSLKAPRPSSHGSVVLERY